MTMLERLGAALPVGVAESASGTKSLMQRVQEAAGDDLVTKPRPDPGTKPTPPLTPEELIEGMVLQWWNSEFMQTMLFEDEEKTGIKAEPYA